MYQSIVEIACGTICGCLPVCPAFFQYLLANIGIKAGTFLSKDSSNPKWPGNKSMSPPGNYARTGTSLGSPSALNRSRRHENYSELDERYPLSEIAATQDAERAAFSQVHRGLGDKERNQENELVAPTVITKTVRLEQSVM